MLITSMSSIIFYFVNVVDVSYSTFIFRYIHKSFVEIDAIFNFCE